MQYCHASILYLHHVDTFVQLRVYLMGSKVNYEG